MLKKRIHYWSITLISITRIIYIWCIEHYQSKNIIICGILIMWFIKKKKNPSRVSQKCEWFGKFIRLFFYCYISMFDFALESYSTVVFVNFRVKYCDYYKSSGAGTEIIAVVDITRRKALKSKVRTVNNWDTPKKHKHNINKTSTPWFSSLTGKGTCAYLHFICSYWVKKKSDVFGKHENKI